MFESIPIERQHVAFAIAFFCVICSTIVSGVHMHRHFSVVTEQALRRNTIRILIMVPFYSVESFFDLYFKHYPGGSVFREGYESVVIWSIFFAHCYFTCELRHSDRCISVILLLWYGVLVTLLGGPENLRQLLYKRYNSVHCGGVNAFRMRHRHPWLFRFCLRPIQTPDDFLVFARAGILQVLTSVVMFICERYGVWHDGEFRVDSGYLWCCWINNFSQVLAIYSLLFFWKGFADELAHFQPALKLLCVKGVVFFSWWQSVALSLLVKYGIIKNTVTYSTEQIALGLQDFLICIEMLGFAICHLYAFPLSDEQHILNPTISTTTLSSSFSGFVSAHTTMRQNRYYNPELQSATTRQVVSNSLTDAHNHRTDSPQDEFSDQNPLLVRSSNSHEFSLGQEFTPFSLINDAVGTLGTHPTFIGSNLTASSAVTLCDEVAPRSASPRVEFTGNANHLPDTVVVRTNNNIPPGSLVSETTNSSSPSHLQRVLSALNPHDIVMDVREAFFHGPSHSSAAGDPTGANTSVFSPAIQQSIHALVSLVPSGTSSTVASVSAAASMKLSLNATLGVQVQTITENVQPEVQRPPHVTAMSLGVKCD